MIPIGYLKTLEQFFIETSTNDKFEITPTEEGYKFRDIVPPVLEKSITDVKSIKIPKNIEVNMKKRGFDPSSIDMSKVLFFDGLAKGFTFVFYTGSDEMNITKGKIDRVYYKQKIGNLVFKVHLLESSGRKVSLNDYQQDFTIVTETQDHVIEKREEEWFFEGRKVYSIYSLFQMKKNPYIDFSVENEYDVSSEFIYLNRPLIILTEHPDHPNQVKFTFLYEEVKDVMLNELNQI